MLKKSLLERLDASLVFGFACCLAWLLITLRAAVLLAAVEEPLLLHVPFYLWLTGAAAVGLAVFGLALGCGTSAMARLLDGPLLRILPAGAMVLGTLLLQLVAQVIPGDSPVAAVLAGACGVLAGLALALLFLQWGAVWTTFDFRTIVVSAIAAWGICQLFFFTVLLFDPIAATVCSAVLPAISLLLLISAHRRTNKVPPYGRGSDHSWRMILRLAALGFVYGLVNEWTRLTVIQQSIEMINQSYFILTNGLALVFALVVVFVTILLPLLVRSEVRFELTYRLVLLLGVVSTLLLVLRTAPPVIPYALNMTAYICLGITLWTATVSLCRRYPAQATRTLGIVIGAWMAGPLVGAQANHELDIVGLLPSPELSAVIGVIAMVLLYCFIYRETDIAHSTMEGRTGEFGEKCAQVAWHFHLTQRESEILMHLARGRDATWIQSELCLSRSTVSTHRQHIYEKLGVHTRQDLIDLIEST